jgi:hypothetical protein
MRISVRKTGATEHGLSAVIVEATQQEVHIPKAIPNASMTSVTELMALLPIDTDRMLIAPISAVAHQRHAGMVVNTKQAQQLQASCVLSLIAHVGRSCIQDLLDGHKIVSKSCWNVPFEEPVIKDDGAPEHTDQKAPGELASYCTMQNVQDYTLTSRKPTEPVYALVVISSVHEAKDVRTYMLDKVCVIDKPDSIPSIRLLLQTLARLSSATVCKGKPNSTPEWRGDTTPYSTKKPRQLGLSPTDAELPIESDASP